MKIEFPSKAKMCKNKRSFHHKVQADKVAELFGQRVYECPICFCFHTTSKENWQDEFLFADDVKTVLEMLEQYHEKKHQKLHARVTQLENELKHLKEKLPKKTATPQIKAMLEKAGEK